MKARRLLAVLSLVAVLAGTLTVGASPSAGAKPARNWSANLPPPPQEPLPLSDVLAGRPPRHVVHLDNERDDASDHASDHGGAAALGILAEPARLRPPVARHLNSANWNTAMGGQGDPIWATRRGRLPVTRRLGLISMRPTSLRRRCPWTTD